jgi:segregation and condensation protein B
MEEQGGGITEPASPDTEGEPAGQTPELVQGDEGTPEPDQETEQPLVTTNLPDEELRSIVEVLLLISDRPLSISRVLEVLDDQNKQKIIQIVEAAKVHLGTHGFPFQVREVAEGYVLSTLPKYAPWVRKFYSPKAKISKLSQAALETLSVIAYKQPVTRAEIEAIRGVNVDSTLRTLLDKRLVEIVGYKDVVGKPATYGTTNEFLLQFGLKALSDLPSIEELRGLNPDKK